MGGGRKRIYVRQRGALYPWLGGGGRMVLGLLPCLLLLRVGGDNSLRPFRFVPDNNTNVGQGHAALCTFVEAEVGATDLVGLGQVSEFAPLGACWRVA